MARVVVAYSGGVDSSLLAKVAHDALGDQAVAVTALSASLAESERAAAARVATEIGIRHELIVTSELDNAAYRRNDRMRCFHCKAELFDCLQRYADEHGISLHGLRPGGGRFGRFPPGAWRPAGSVGLARLWWKPACAKPTSASWPAASTCPRGN